MLERLTPLLALGEPVFVVVGAGHVVGRGGIPALLAERGLHVERLRGPE